MMSLAGSSDILDDMSLHGSSPSASPPPPTGDRSLRFYKEPLKTNSAPSNSAPSSPSPSPAPSPGRSTTTSSSRTSSLADSFVPLFSPPSLILCSCGRTECEAHLYLDVLITVFSRVFGKLKREFDKFLKPPPSPSTPSTPSLCSPLLSFISSTLSSLNHAQPSSFAFLRFFLVNRCNAPSLFNSFLQTIQQASTSAQQSSTTLQPLFNDLASTIATLYGQTLTVSLSQPVQPTALDSALYNSYLTTIPLFLLTSLKDTVFVLSSTLLPLSTIESLFALMNGAPPSSSSLTVHHPEVIPLIFSCFHKSNQLLQKVSCGHPLLPPPARAHKSTSGCGAPTAKKTCPSAAEVGSLSERKRELAELAAAADQRPTQTTAGAKRAGRAG